jgi:hypothetical protein
MDDIELEEEGDEAAKNAWWDIISMICLVGLLVMAIVTACIVLPSMLSVSRFVRNFEQLRIVERIDKVIQGVEESVPTLKSVAEKTDKLLEKDIDTILQGLTKFFSSFSSKKDGKQV